VQAILDSIDQVCVVEGELDAVASTLAGYPAVALPGVNGYKRHFARCFDGIGRVLVITDNDDKEDGSNPGQELAKKLLEVLPNGVRVSLPKGEDINSTILSHGAQHYAELIGAVE
jgi:DNA primase